jgi:hypothetical protein
MTICLPTENGGFSESSVSGLDLPSRRTVTAEFHGRVDREKARAAMGASSMVLTGMFPNGKRFRTVIAAGPFGAGNG